MAAQFIILCDYTLMKTSLWIPFLTLSAPLIQHANLKSVIALELSEICGWKKLSIGNIPCSKTTIFTLHHLMQPHKVFQNVVRVFNKNKNKKKNSCM